MRLRPPIARRAQTVSTGLTRRRHTHDRINAAERPTHFVAVGVCAQRGRLRRPVFWNNLEETPADTHWAFRGTFTVPCRSTILLEHSAADPYRLFLDGREIAEGPLRFHPDHPECFAQHLPLRAGAHVFACHVHHQGVATRLMPGMPPFLHIRISGPGNDRAIPVAWRFMQLEGYVPRRRRISACLAWMEWCDTRDTPKDWPAPGFNDRKWAKARNVKHAARPFAPAQLAPLKRIEIRPKLIGSGPLVSAFGYEKDNPPAAFLLNRLDDTSTPPQGCWRRYDLDAVLLGRPRFVIDAPAGAQVSFGHAECLRSGRVAPFITLSGSESCNMSVFIARGGPQLFHPLNPLGGRFLEVQVLSPKGRVRFLEERFVERSYYCGPDGAFSCKDRLLNRIWEAGVRTLRSCAEDAIVDNPTRERGQWLGDATLGLHTASVAYSDIRLMKRTLEQAAQWARPDGLVAAMGGGQNCYVGSFAAQWVRSCLHYHQLTGEKGWVADLYPAAVRNCSAFETALGRHGVATTGFWNFIDWGYCPPERNGDLALNLFVLDAFDAIESWAGLLCREKDAARYRQLAGRLGGTVARQAGIGMPGYVTHAHCTAWGYHAAVLLLARGLIPARDRRTVVSFVKQQWRTSFPNLRTAPRLADPSVCDAGLVTPYFAHFALDALIRAGETDFVLDQYRRSWGWMLAQGLTTLAEVFDLRWSHCHQWSACPTWQMSRYLLGLCPRFDRGTGHYELELKPGSMRAASGVVPVNGTDDRIRIAWRRKGRSIRYTIDATRPVWLHLPSENGQAPGRIQAVRRRRTLVIAAP
jgi:hypothetical protein